MEIKGIEDPFKFSRKLISKCQKEIDGIKMLSYYSPNRTRKPSKTAEGEQIQAYEMNSIQEFKDIYKEYGDYIINYIEDLNKVFNMGDDWGIYIGEVKYLSPEVEVDYNNLSLKQYPNV